GIEPASLAWKARVIASIRTPRLLGFDINELDQNAKVIFGDIFDRVFGWLCPIRAPLVGHHQHSQMIFARFCRLLCPKMPQYLWFE
ncbi:hypothetical protein OAI23_06595, partial [Alphaproteobacteria bacterium]|nr:hypothetical protein [Alphaproteobacteria bacterium]